VEGLLKLSLPAGWKSDPAWTEFQLNKWVKKQRLRSNVFPGSETITGSVSAIAEVSGHALDRSLMVIGYDHIPIQTLLPKAEAKVVRLDLNRRECG